MTSVVSSRIQTAVTQLSYKPGWKITVRVIDDVPHLDVESDLMPNSRDVAARITRIGRSEPLPVGLEDLDDTQLLRRVIGLAWQIIAELEVHEAQEWLKLDGRIIDDPHDYGRDELTAGEQFLIALWHARPHGTSAQPNYLAAQD